MRATQQLKYAISGVFDLAYHGSDHPVPIQEIGARQGIPSRYLEQIFQRLRRGGLVRSKRGPGGGYLLARAPEEITLADVALAVEGAIVSGVDGPSGGDSGRGGPSFVWDRLREAVEGALAATTIAELCREAAERGVEREAADGSMYYI